MGITLSDQLIEDLIFFDVEADNQIDLLEKMSNILHERGYVTADYKDSIIKREKLYPTGLKLEEIQFAIPHTDADLVIKPGVAFVQLKNRVRFTEMATFDGIVDAKVVFMLLLHKDGSQVELLQDIIARACTPGFISSLEEAKTKEEVIRIIAGNNE